MADQQWWLTSHWPHPIPNHLPWWVYLKQEDQVRGQKLMPGDRVVFYESGALKIDGRIATHVKSRSTGEMVPLRKGRAGVVGVARVSEYLRPRRPDTIPYDYGDRDPLEWAWEAPCEDQEFGRPIPYVEMIALLQWSRIPAHTFGLRRISGEEFDKLVHRLRSK